MRPTEPSYFGSGCLDVRKGNEPMNDENLKLIAYEISRLRGAIMGLCWILVICTVSIALTLWNPELIIFILIVLGITLLVSFVSVTIGLGLGKSIKHFRNR